MDFELPVLLNNKELLLPGKFLDYGYSSKIEIDVEGTKLIFEPDEERNWRAVISYEDMQADKKLNQDMVKAITVAIEKVMK